MPHAVLRPLTHPSPQATRERRAQGHPTLTQRLLKLLRVRFSEHQADFGAGLSNADRQVIGAICPPRRCGRGEYIYRQGEPSGTLYILLEGHVKLSATGRLGGERVLSICGPDDFFGESFLSESPITASDAVCLSEQALVCPISLNQFLEIVRGRPEVAVLLASILATRVKTLQDRLDAQAQPVQVRLAQVMLDLALRLGKEVSPGLYELDVELRHEEIASLAQASRVSATQAISAWRQRELVLGTRGHYRIDVSGLELLIEECQLEALG